MKRNIFTLLAVIFMTVILQGCGSTKGYSGGKLQSSELARIESGTHKLIEPSRVVEIAQKDKEQ